VTIAVDTYFTVVPSNFLSKAHVTYAGQEYFFYITTLGQLRVQVFGSSLSYTIATNVKQVQVLPASDHVNVYYRIGRTVYYVAFKQLGSGLSPVSTGVTDAQNFSVFYNQNTAPPCYLLMNDDGVHHILFVAVDAAFQTLLAAPLQIYNNAIDQTFYVFGPRIVVHPQDSTRLTVLISRQTIATGAIEVGMYETLIPGVGS
jgi:hypothetical protein